jgi:MOSC domain-containing protein YiiM
MQGEVIQINISAGGIPKRPVREALLTPFGIEGDACDHPEIHGGPNKAVLLISAEVVDELVRRGYPLFYGAMGENLTIRGLDHRQMRCGQRYRAGHAMLELTTVRSPCATLDMYGISLQKEIYDSRVKAGDPGSPRWGMSGFYAAVVQPGLVRQHDIIFLVDQVV